MQSISTSYLPETTAQQESVMEFLQTQKDQLAQSPKLMQHVMNFLQGLSHKPRPTRRRIMIPSEQGFTLVDETEIMYLEANGSYTNVILQNGTKMIVSRRLKEFCKLLDRNLFERIHRSHIINLKYLKAYARTDGGTVTLINGKQLLISRRRLPCFMEKVTRMTISLY